MLFFRIQFYRSIVTVRAFFSRFHGPFLLSTLQVISFFILFFGSLLLIAMLLEYSFLLLPPRENCYVMQLGTNWERQQQNYLMKSIQN